MKFDTEVRYEKDKHREHWLLGVRLTSMAAPYSIFRKNQQ